MSKALGFAVILGAAAFMLSRRAGAAQSPAASGSAQSWFDSLDFAAPVADPAFDWDSWDAGFAVAPEAAVVFDDVKSQTSMLDDLLADFTPVSWGFDPMQNANVQAFLAMIRYAEGANYNTLFGGSTFSSYADHPRTLISASGYRSTAAGAYQILQRTWDDVRGRIGAPDFSPAWQDAAAVFLIKRRGALPDVLAGNFDSAVSKVRKEWASLPGAGYGQPERALQSLRSVYANAGGSFGTPV